MSEPELRRAFRAAMRELRHRKGWTQRDLTREGKFGTSYVATLENGTYLPSLQTFAKLAGLFGVTLEEFGALLDAQDRLNKLSVAA